MTAADALTLRVGDHVLHRAGISYRADGTPAMKPNRVTEVWVNEKRSIVMIRCAMIDADTWVHATEFELPPAGLRWDRHENEWIGEAEYRRRREAAKQ